MDALSIESNPIPINTESKINILDMDFASLKNYFVQMGEKPFRATQLFKWIYQRGITNFEDMSDLSKSLRAYLQTHCEVLMPEIVVEKVSKDGTLKWLLRLKDGNQIETVFIPEPARGTLCVSSQVGCVLSCRFCSTGTQGFNRNLTQAEIIGQVLLASIRIRSLSDAANNAKFKDKAQFNNNCESLHSRITNVVMMGMGEPLYNFENVVGAMSIMREDNAFNLSKRRVTLSTAGMVPHIDRLSETIDVSLAVSLHAPNNELRDYLVPINKKYPLEELIPACKRYIAEKPGRHVTIEYVMLDGVNDSPECAKQLVKLLQGVESKINLIPFNPFPGSIFKRSKSNVIAQFKEIVNRAGMITTVRKTRGDDIDAACGQLVGRVIDKTHRQARFKEHLKIATEVKIVEQSSAESKEDESWIE